MTPPHGDADDGPVDHEQDDFAVFVVRQRARLEQRARTLAATTGVDHHDLFSHTLAVLHRKWHAIVPPRVRTGRAFARTVMANRLRDLQRGTSARADELTGDVAALLERRLPPDQWADDPEYEVLRKEHRTRIYRAIRVLPELERTVMALRTEEHTFTEIAEVLGTAPAEVRNAMLRARRLLRPLLEEGGDDDR